MASVAKEEVLRLIPKMSELQLLEICDNEGLQLTKSKRDRKSALGNMLRRHVLSEDVEDLDDEGLALFEKLSALMTELLGEDLKENDDGDAAKQELIRQQRLLLQQQQEHERIKSEYEAKHQVMEMELESAFQTLKSAAQQFESDPGHSQPQSQTVDKAGSSQDASVETALSRLAGGKSEVDFESLVERIVTKRLNESGLLNEAISGGGIQSFSAGGTQAVSSGGVQLSTSGGVVYSYPLSVCSSGSSGGIESSTSSSGVQSSRSSGGVQSSTPSCGVQSSMFNGGVQSLVSSNVFQPAMTNGGVQLPTSTNVVQSSRFNDGIHSSTPGGGVQVPGVVTGVVPGDLVNVAAAGSDRQVPKGTTASTTTTTTGLHRLRVREFKIANGSIGVEGSLDYADLIMQMKEGLSLGYDHREVMSGVIRGIKPGSELRKYFVRKGEMSYEDFKQTLREFYDVRESEAIMDEMKDMKQGENQDLVKYVMSMCALRDEALEVAATEECPPGAARIVKRFIDCTLSGLQKPTVRLEMQGVLNLKLPDPTLFKEVRELDKRVKENERKVGVETQSVNVKAVEVKKQSNSKCLEDKWKQETAGKLEQLTTQVAKLEALIRSTNAMKSTNATGAVHSTDAVMMSNDPMDAKFAVLLGQVEHLTAQLQAHGGGGSSGGKYKFRKCDECEQAKKFCRHCRKCKQEGHKESECPEN